ncbi:MAG: hypothetical protein OEZ68_05310 [Gammaproteobacteria bacterium]|nr:hypothetical protein [Gammaproteobacteria bacterium]MDH5800208.1 hypothetical protein [Gammaproteobacteria bacterium]
MSVWVGLRCYKNEGLRPFRSLWSVLIEMTVCSVGYGVFLFVVTLAIGVAIWLLLLGFVYIPADLYHNTIGGQAMEQLVNKISPYIHRSHDTPGITGQPILDYCTLSVLILAPLAGIWATFNNHKPKKKPPPASPPDNSPDESHSSPTTTP